MRYLLALLLMIMVGWDAVAQTPVPPEVRFKESGPTMVTEGVHTTVEISLELVGGDPRAYPTDVTMDIPSSTGDYWPFTKGSGGGGAAFSVEFQAGEIEKTLSIQLKADDQVAQSLGEEFTLTIILVVPQGTDTPPTIDSQRDTHTIVWIDDDTLALPAVSFEMATSEAEEGSDLVGGVTAEEKNIHLTLDKPAENDLYVNVEIEKAAGTTHWPFLLFEDEEMGEAERTVYFEAGNSKATLDLSFADDNAPRPPQMFTLKIIEEDGAPPPFDQYRIGTISTNTLTVNDDDSIVLNVTPTRTGFKVQPNRPSVEGYTVRWVADGPGIAAGQTIKTDTIDWPEDDLEPKTVLFDFDCANGDVLITIRNPVVTSSGNTASYVIPLDGSVGGLPTANLCGDTASSHSPPPSGGGTPGGGTPGGGTPGGGTPGGGTPGGGTPGGGTPGGGTPGGGTPGGGTPGGGTPGGDDPMDPPGSSDDPMDPEVASDSDGGCSLSGGSDLNQLASNAVAMGLVLMFGLCLLMPGWRKSS